MICDGMWGYSSYIVLGGAMFWHVVLGGGNWLWVVLLLVYGVG